MQECQKGRVLLNVVGVVVGDAVGDDVVGDVERGGDGGSARHVRDDWFSGEEAGDREARRAKRKVGFGAFFIELGAVDTEGGCASCAVGEGVGLANETREVWVVYVVFVEDDDFWVHGKERGFVGGEAGCGGSVERGGDKVRQSGSVHGETVEDVVLERIGGSGDDDVRR